MKYFLLHTDTVYTTSPEIINWYRRIDVRNIHYEKAHLLPKRELLFMRGYADTVFTDIVDSPFLMVSELIKKVICMYQPETIFKEIILLDAVYEKSRRYFLPVFRKQHCLSEKSILNLDRSVIKQGILSRSKLNDQAVFRIGDVKNNYTVGRLDFVESILKRGAVGVGLTELGMED